MDVSNADGSVGENSVAPYRFARSVGPYRGARRGLPRARPVPRRVAHRGAPHRRRVRAPRSPLSGGPRGRYALGLKRGGGYFIDEPGRRRRRVRRRRGHRGRVQTALRASRRRSRGWRRRFYRLWHPRERRKAERSRLRHLHLRLDGSAQGREGDPRQLHELHLLHGGDHRGGHERRVVRGHHRVLRHRRPGALPAPLRRGQDGAGVAGHRRRSKRSVGPHRARGRQLRAGHPDHVARTDSIVRRRHDVAARRAHGARRRGGGPGGTRRRYGRRHPRRFQRVRTDGDDGVEHVRRD